MRQDQEHLPTLDVLINEVTDVALRKKDHVALQLIAPPKRQRLIGVCGLPHHKGDCNFYKHAHLRRPNWQPNNTIVQHIKMKQKALHNMSCPSTSDSKSSDVEFDIFACTLSPIWPCYLTGSKLYHIVSLDSGDHYM